MIPQVKKVAIKTNLEYNLIIKKLHMKLETFCIDNSSDLIIQFPVFCNPICQLPLTLFYKEVLPVPLIDQNIQVNTYSEILISKPYIALKERYSHQYLSSCKNIWYEFYCEEIFVVKHNFKYTSQTAIIFAKVKKSLKTVVFFYYF